jgi:hypothetical protein
MWLNPLRFPRYRGTETPPRAKKAFRGKTECLPVPDEGSHSSYGDGGQGESPLVTEGRALMPGGSTALRESTSLH